MITINSPCRIKFTFQKTIIKKKPGLECKFKNNDIDRFLELFKRTQCKLTLNQMIFIITINSPSRIKFTFQENVINTKSGVRM